MGKAVLWVDYIAGQGRRCGSSRRRRRCKTVELGLARARENTSGPRELKPY